MFLSVKLAERGGFEPPVQCYPYDGLANRIYSILKCIFVSKKKILFTRKT